MFQTTSYNMWQPVSQEMHEIFKNALPYEDQAPTQWQAFEVSWKKINVNTKKRRNYWSPSLHQMCLHWGQRSQWLTELSEPLYYWWKNWPACCQGHLLWTFRGGWGLKGGTCSPLICTNTIWSDAVAENIGAQSQQITVVPLQSRLTSQQGNNGGLCMIFFQEHLPENMLYALFF